MARRAKKLTTPVVRRGQEDEEEAVLLGSDIEFSFDLEVQRLEARQFL
jgi:hypothetical protein